MTCWWPIGLFQKLLFQHPAWDEKDCNRMLKPCKKEIFNILIKTSLFLLSMVKQDGGTIFIRLRGLEKGKLTLSHSLTVITPWCHHQREVTHHFNWAGSQKCIHRPRPSRSSTWHLCLWHKKSVVFVVRSGRSGHWCKSEYTYQNMYFIPWKKGQHNRGQLRFLGSDTSNRWPFDGGRKGKPKGLCLSGSVPKC